MRASGLLRASRKLPVCQWPLLATDRV